MVLNNFKTVDVDAWADFPSDYKSTSFERSNNTMVQVVKGIVIAYVQYPMNGIEKSYHIMNDDSLIADQKIVYKLNN
jgi:hypothetical protein